MNINSEVNFETYKKDAINFSNEKMNMAVNLTLKNRGSYNNDTDHGRALYTDENLLLTSGAENDVEWNNNEQIKELRNKVIAKMSKRYFARI